MNISVPFIARPVATTLLTISVALADIFAFLKLPVSPLPQVDFLSSRCRRSCRAPVRTVATLSPSRWSDIWVRSPT
jgi:multidrug efflux pump